MIEIENVHKSFGNLEVLKGIDLTVQKGEVVSVIGGSGSGKSTLLTCINGLEKIDSGRILVDGTEVHAKSTDLNKLRRKIGIVFQQFNAFPHLTVLENVRVALQSGRGTQWQFWRSLRAIAPLNARAMELLEKVGLADAAHLTAAELSYGKKRALEIATTLALDPRVLLLDEPTAGMGHEDVEPITALIREAAVGRTVLIVEHNLSVVSNLCDRITVLTHGQVLTEGSYAEVSANPEVITAYMGGVDDE